MLLAATLAVSKLDAYLRDLQVLAESSPQEAAEKALLAGRIFLGALLLAAIVLAAVLGRLSWRTLRGERYPPAGVRVLHETRVVVGAEARRQGRRGLALAALVLLAGLWVSCVAERRLSERLERSLGPTWISPQELGVR